MTVKGKRINQYFLNRCLYITEALLEYLISLTIAGAFIARLSSYIGLPDEITGIITGMTSLGVAFQFLEQSNK